MLVWPPWYQAFQWCASVHATGAVQPGNRQPWSRACNALRIQCGTRRCVRPTSNGMPVVGSSTARQTSQSHAIRWAMAAGMSPNQSNLAGSGRPGTPAAANASHAAAAPDLGCIPGGPVWRC